MQNLIKINEKDNVAVALQDIPAGAVLDGFENMIALQDIPAGHKVAIAPVTENSEVIKYGYSIGTATKDILAGQWVHEKSNSRFLQPETVESNREIPSYHHAGQFASVSRSSYPIRSDRT